MATIINAGQTALTITPDTTGALTLQANGTNALQITANGQITTANAPFILTGGRIQFPGTPIASGDSNCLDDYEEGTWAVGIGSAGVTSGQVYSNQDGRYVKVGQMVFASFDLRLSNKGTLNSDILITNLPFTSRSGGYYGGGPITNYDALASSWIYLVMRVQDNGTALTLSGRQTAGTSISALQPADIGNSTILMGTIVYQAAV